MKRLIFLLFALTFAANLALANDQSSPKSQDYCNLFSKYGLPVDNRPYAIMICRTAYGIKYDPQAKIPVWVAYTLTASRAVGCATRSNAFASDQSLKRNEKSTLEDYSHSGYDTGHLAPAGDMTWDESVERESYILSNTAPQTAELNRGVWKTLETAVRSWAYNNNSDLVIYTGSIYDIKQNKTIGPNNVVVPYGFYKIVIDTVKNQSLAFIFDNSKKPVNDLAYYQVTVQDIEAATGIKFNIPDNKFDKHNIWLINTILLSTAKKKLCNQ